MWPFEEEDDGALTVHHDHTFASLRVVAIAEGLEMVSLTQILAWDLPLDNEIRDKVGRLAHDTVLGTVSLAEQVARRWQPPRGRHVAALQLPGRRVDRRSAAHAAHDGAQHRRRCARRR